MSQLLKNNSRFYKPLFLLVICCWPLFFFAQKNDKKTLENKRKKLNDEINQLNQFLNETKNTKKVSMNQLLILNKKITVREELIKEIGSELNNLSSQINQNNFKIKQLNKDLSQLKSDYSRMIVAAYKNKSAYNSLMFIFSSNDFAQAYSRLKYMQQINEQRRKQALDISNTQKEIGNTVLELQGKKVERSSLLQSEQKEKSSLTTEKVEKEQTLVALQEKEKTLKDQLEKKKQETIKLQFAIQELIKAEIARKQKEIADKALARAKRKSLLEAAKKKSLADKKKKDIKSKTNVDGDNSKKTESKENVVIDSKKNTESDTEVDLSEPEESTTPMVGGDFASNKGNLPWPVSKGVIVESFGEHEHSVIKGFMTFNNGVDISTGKGAQVRAIHSGVVTSVANFNNLGKLVIIRHGEYLSVYVHLGEVYVVQGQKITAKQAIGTVLYDENENKNILQLQVWKGQSKLNPAAWISN